MAPEPATTRASLGRSVGTSAAALALVAAVSLGLARAAEDGPRPPAPRARATVGRAGPEALQIAGSGANVPLMRRLCAGSSDVRVHDSIGTGGGLRALRDGAIDVALLSRPLTAEERADLRVATYARSPLVWATQSAVRDASLDDLRRWYAGAGPLRPLLRELGDSGIRAVRAIAPAVADAHDAAVRARAGELLLTEEAMLEALRQLPRSFGLTDLGQLRLSPSAVHPIAIDGVTPSRRAVREGRYRFVRELAVAVRTDDARANAFVDRLLSPSMQAAIEASGYLPVEP